MGGTVPEVGGLSRSQVAALVTAAYRELSWGLPAVSRAEEGWRMRAAAIPDARLRAAAICSLATKRGHTDGAACFSILPTRRSADLLRALTALQMILDYLDCVHEQAPDERNGRQLHLAFLDALDPRRPVVDWYRYGPWSGDGGYLATLVATCRAACARLPSYAVVRDRALAEAWRCQVLALNHLTDPWARDAALQAWADDAYPGETGLVWFERSGAGSTLMPVLALLALAVRPGVQEREVAATCAAYLPWVSLAATMLDSYVDQAEDRDGDAHSYVGHYPSPRAGWARLREIVANALASVSRLPDGHRHTVLVACMVAMYLSKDSANVPELRDSTRALVEAGGSLTRLLVPILRLWRIRYGQQTA